MGYVLSALITGIFGIVIVLLQIRATRATKDIHDEVRTNHGIRAGQRLEDLGVDVAELQSYVKEKLVTKDELQAHADADVLVAEKLTAANMETRTILLSAIQMKGN